jgi:HSP20 family molecular chaperone IbpA
MDNGKNKKDGDAEGVNINIDFGLGRLFGNLKNIIDAVSDIKGGEIKKEGTLGDSAGKVKGVYGLTIKTMGDTTSVERFGNRVKKDDKDGEVTIDKVREPIVDVFDEGGSIVVVSEMPGVEEKDIKVLITGDILQIEAKSPAREYEKEILLKSKVLSEPEKSSYLNGVLELRLVKNEEGI